MTETEHLLEAVVETGVSGAVVVADGRGGRVEAAAGVADVTTGEPLTPAHRFRIGSVTKIFVAPLVLRLVEEGLLDLDGDAAPFAGGITIRQLLNHTSGLDDFMGDPIAFFEPYRNDPDHRWELDARDELDAVLQKPRLFQPGHGWAYHGSNYIVLRLLVEEATGSSLRDALRERIFEPLGLDRTDLVEGPLGGDCARGYLPPDNPILPGGPGPVDVTGIDVPFHHAGGGIVSTAGEVATLLRALLGGDEGGPGDVVHAALVPIAAQRPGRRGGAVGSSHERMPAECCFHFRQRQALVTQLDGTVVTGTEDEAAVSQKLHAVRHREFPIRLADEWRPDRQPANEAAEGALFDAAGELAWHLFCA